MQRVPARCIVLLEDLDAAFTRSANRDDDSNTGVPSGSKGTSTLDEDERHGRGGSSFSRGRTFVPDYNTLSLSGLLNSLDGVSAPEGRLLFACVSFFLLFHSLRTSRLMLFLLSNSTTNHLERLDPALTRPGRMDVWVEFKNASKWQAELLFHNFFTEVEEELKQAVPPSAEELAAMEKEFAFLEQQAKNATEGGVKINTISGVDGEGIQIKSDFVPKDGSIPSSMAGVEAMVAGVEEKESAAFKIIPPVLERPAGPLGPIKLAALAKRFADAIPDQEHSVASLQGCEFDFASFVVMFH